MSNTLVGGYELANMEPCNLPDPVATGFQEVMGGMVGATYTPVLYVGSQLVHGTNYMVICKQTLAAAGAPEHLVELVLNQCPEQDGSLTGKWSIVTVKQIV